jgi:hypothetical protein
MKRVALIGVVALVAMFLSRPAGSDTRTGIGETVLLVVADVVDPGSAGATADRLNTRFGELRGFSIDSTDAYDVRAILVQTSADLVRSSCGGPSSLECPPGATAVDVFRPVGLRYVPKSDAAAFGDPSRCGRVGAPPCQRERVRALLGSGSRFEAGRSVIATGFRTKRGAAEFIEFARTAGVTGLVTVQARKLGGGDIGLGQEPHPNGGGPLEVHLDDQEAFQR